MKKEWERLEPIRIRVMSEAYDLADRGDSEGCNSVKVMCSDVLALIETALAHSEQRHVIDCPRCGHCCPERQAPEGWVKIDEVRHFLDSVGCATIYKTAGEGRVPLYTAPQREWVGLTDKERADWHAMGLVGVELVAAHLEEKNRG